MDRLLDLGYFQNALYLRDAAHAFCRQIASKRGLTASPSSESRTGDPRSNKGRPSSCSNRRIAFESEGWEMPLIAAARVNAPTWHKTRKYLICRSSIKPS